MSAFPYLSGTANTVIPAASSAPSVTPSGSAWTYGSYTQLLASAASNLLLTGLTVTGGETFAVVGRYELQIAVGPGGSETPIATIPGVTSNASAVGGVPSLSLPYPIAIASGARIAARIRRSDTVAVAYKVALRVVPASFTGVLYDTTATIAAVPSGAELFCTGSATSWVNGAAETLTAGLGSDAVVFAMAMGPSGLGWSADWECDLLVAGVVTMTIRDGSTTWDEGGWRPVPPFALPAGSALTMRLRTNAGAARAVNAAAMYYVNPGADVPSDTLVSAAPQVYPAAAAGLSVTAGASQAYGAWVEAIPAPATDLALIDVVNTTLTAACHVQVGTGEIGSEQPIATINVSGLSANYRREWMPFMVPPSTFLLAGERVSLRVRNNGSAVVHTLALVVLPIASLGLTIAAVPKVAPNDTIGAVLTGTGAAWTNGAWVEALPALSDTGHVYGLSYAAGSGTHEFEIDLRIGLTVAYTWRGVTGGSGRFVLPSDTLIKVDPDQALSLRVRSDDGSSQTAAILYYGPEPPASLIGSAVFGRDTTVTASLAIAMGLDGDTHVDNTPNTLTVYGDLAVEGGAISIDGAPVLSTATGAPVAASYVTLATNATLTNERVITAGTGIGLTDAGVGSTLTVATVNVPESAFAFTDVTTANATASQHGLLPKLSNDTGTFLRGDGSFATVSGTGSGVVNSVSVNMSHSQIGSLNSSPVTIVSAPGAGLAVFFLAIYNSTDFSAGVYSNDTVRVRYAGGTTDLCATFSGFLNQSAKRGNQLPLTAVGILASEFTNKAITISTSANSTGGNAANHWIATILYTTMSVL